MSKRLAVSLPPISREVFIARRSWLRSQLLDYIAPLITASINHGAYPGAVVAAARHGVLFYRGVFGNRRVLPDPAPMQWSTIFDIASLTKVVVTTPAILQLVEQGRLELDDSVAYHWPEFAAHGKDTVTIRHLLTHTSGLPPLLYTPELVEVLESAGKPVTVEPAPAWHGYMAAIQQLEQCRLQQSPGAECVYGDGNFIALGHLVQLITGIPLDQYASTHIFRPLAMHRSGYLPLQAQRDVIAPTQMLSGALRWGEVHDPVTHQMGGVSGSAGVFATAADLGVFAQCLLNDGRLPRRADYLLSPLTVRAMTTPQTLGAMGVVRGLGWDINSAFSSRGALFPIGSFGHTGWTGTSLWIDPHTATWLVILTSRTHPQPALSTRHIRDRRLIANIVAASVIATETT